MTRARMTNADNIIDFCAVAEARERKAIEDALDHGRHLMVEIGKLLRDGGFDPDQVKEVYATIFRIARQPKAASR